MNKKLIKLFALPVLVAAMASCTDYQSDIDAQGTRIDNLNALTTSESVALSYVAPTAKVIEVDNDNLAAVNLQFKLDNADWVSIIKTTDLDFIVGDGSAADLTVNSITVDNAAEGLFTVNVTPTGFVAGEDYNFGLKINTIKAEEKTYNSDVYGTVYMTALSAFNVKFTTLKHMEAGTTVITIGNAQGLANGASVVPGQIVNMTESIVPATTDALVWHTSNPAVATVDADGNVTFVGEGDVEIWATNEDGTIESNHFSFHVAGGDIPVKGDGVQQQDAQ